jgi:hypothetical protein
MNISAFPIQSVYIEDEATNSRGMTLRDYFAAKAMEAVIINSDRGSTVVDEIHTWIGNYAYIVADAMMKAREE